MDTKTIFLFIFSFIFLNAFNSAFSQNNFFIKGGLIYTFPTGEISDNHSPQMNYSIGTGYDLTKNLSITINYNKISFSNKSYTSYVQGFNSSVEKINQLNVECEQNLYTKNSFNFTASIGTGINFYEEYNFEMLESGNIINDFTEKKTKIGYLGGLNLYLDANNKKNIKFLFKANYNFIPDNNFNKSFINFIGGVAVFLD